MAETDAYDEALKSGQYQKPGGLLGKYGNVSRFWEDEQLGLYLRPHLERLAARKKERGEGLRLLDLGCGSGDGFEFITSINSSNSLISEHNTKVLEPNNLFFEILTFLYIFNHFLSLMTCTQTHNSTIPLSKGPLLS